MAGCPERITATPQKRGHCDAKIKRLEKGSYRFPVRRLPEMTPTQLSLILSGIDLRSARQRKRYQRPMLEAENRPFPS